MALIGDVPPTGRRRCVWPGVLYYWPTTVPLFGVPRHAVSYQSEQQFCAAFANEHFALRCFNGRIKESTNILFGLINHRHPHGGKPDCPAPGYQEWPAYSAERSHHRLQGQGATGILKENPRALIRDRYQFG